MCGDIVCVRLLSQLWNEDSCDKGQFFVVSGVERHKAALTIASLALLYRSIYLYPGVWFTDTFNVKDIAALHEVKNQTTVYKFAIFFCGSNNDTALKYKTMLFDAAVCSSC